MFQVRLRQSTEDVQYQILARGPEEAESTDREVLVDYFNLQTPLQQMSKEWDAKDSRFRLVSPYFPGRASGSETPPPAYPRLAQELHSSLEGLIFRPTCWSADTCVQDCKRPVPSIQFSGLHAAMQMQTCECNMFSAYRSSACLEGSAHVLEHLNIYKHIEANYLRPLVQDCLASRLNQHRQAINVADVHRCKALYITSKYLCAQIQQQLVIGLDIGMKLA